ncbi:EAL domain-containing protein [uncultured Litoreibacter sp.]|uniref:EAL domain-containing protein n=1 Tax=uncultured Litoreibacter sp. TaxID=1392394 RepID=UPI0026261297|nr:EAL domain-containing protein [uncultured Litoreibacter sp.]
MSENQDWAIADNPLAAAVQQRDADMLQMVRHGLETRNVMLAFQPIVQAANVGVPAFYEGLIRVMDDTGRVIPARDFISAIEPLPEGRIIDCLALDMGCNALMENPSLRLSINLSPRSIGNPQWEQVLETALGQDPTLGERLILEITEASAMVMPDAVVNFMDRIHDKGICFALDDFGAGYTAFRYFKDFYFDLVKIDCGFIRNIDRDPDNQILTEALVSIAQHFDMFTVAEGIEAAAEAEYLIGAQVDCLQGYLFGAPKLRLPENAKGSFSRAG